MSEKHYPCAGGEFDRIVFDGDGSVWVRERTCHKKKHLNLTIGDEFLTQSGWDCSECGGRLDLPIKAFYCPNCGAKVVDDGGQ